MFWLMRQFGLTGTHVGLILIYVMIQLPFIIWMMKGFFDEVPTSIEESVLVDGGSRGTAMYRVILPLAFPGNRRHGPVLHLPDLDGVPLRLALHQLHQRHAPGGFLLVPAGPGNPLGADERRHDGRAHPDHGHHDGHAEADDQGAHRGGLEVLRAGPWPREVRMSMTPRERVVTALAHKEPDRVPDRVRLPARQHPCLRPQGAQEAPGAFRRGGEDPGRVPADRVPRRSAPGTLPGRLPARLCAAREALRVRLLPGGDFRKWRGRVGHRVSPAGRRQASGSTSRSTSGRASRRQEIKAHKLPDPDDPAASKA